MTEKSLKNKAIKIKGKDYVLVSDRVLYFNETFENGSIKTELISQPTDEIVCIKATITPDCDKEQRQFTGYAQEKRGEGFINKTSAIENAETSAVGRALAMMGIGVIDSIASVDEINKANNRQKAPSEGVGGQKPRFKEKEFKSLEEKKDNYKTGEEAVKVIKDHYNISQAMETKVLSLYITDY